MRRTTDAGLALIKAFEGRALQAYRCPAGVWTIGFGHTSAAGGPPVTPGMTITAQEADVILAADIDLFEDGVAKLLRKARVNVVEPHEFDAMVSLAFNIGINAFARSTVLARYLRNDKAGAAAAFGFWVKANGVTMAGLVRRRKAEAKLFAGKLEEANAIGDRGGFGPMPQKVDAPRPPKTMATSKTGNAAVAAGAGGAAVVIDAAGKALEQADKAKETARHAGEIFGLSGSTALLIGAGLIIVCAAVFIWWDRRRRLREDLA